MHVHGDELAGLCFADGGDGGEEVDELLGVVSLAEEEVDARVDFFDVDGVFVGAVLEDELFEIEEGAFVWDFLADLDVGSPGVVGV